MTPLEETKEDVAVGLSLKEIDEKYKASQEAKLKEKDPNKAAL